MSDNDDGTRQSQLQTRSRVSSSLKSCRASTRTSVSAAATRARAKAEAAKIKVSYAEKEAAIMKEKVNRGQSSCFAAREESCSSIKRGSNI